jgi:hypothetical protein
MVAVGMVQSSIHQVIDVVAMGHGLVAAARPMGVGAARMGTARGVARADRDHMLIDMITVHVMEMTVMEVIDVSVMTDRRVSTVRTVSVGMVGMMRLSASGHRAFLFVGREQVVTGFGSMLAAPHQADVGVGSE